MAAAKLVSTLGVGSAIDRVGFRVGPGTDPWDGVTTAVDLSARVGCGATVTVCLSPEGPDEANLDEIWLANRVAIAALAAAARPPAVVILDTFIDFDRGYFARHADLAAISRGYAGEFAEGLSVAKLTEAWRTSSAHRRMGEKNSKQVTAYGRLPPKSQERRREA